MRTYQPEPGVQFVEANGPRHAFFEEGDGPLVLMFHGFPDTPHTWDQARPRVAAAGFRVVTPFLRGYAPSEVPAQDTDVRTQGEDALALIEALGEERAILVGHDWGAMSAIAAAALDEARVSRLVTVAIPHPAGLKPSLKLAWSARHFVTLRLPGAVERLKRDDFGQVEALTRRWGPTWDVGPADLEPVKNAFSAPGSANAALGYYRKITAPPRWLRKPLQVPTLAVAGADDPSVSPAQFEDAGRKFRGPYEVATISGGHFCHREDPDAFAEHLLRFIGRGV